MSPPFDPRVQQTVEHQLKVCEVFAGLPRGDDDCGGLDARFFERPFEGGEVQLRHGGVRNDRGARPRQHVGQVLRGFGDQAVPHHHVIRAVPQGDRHASDDAHWLALVLGFSA